MSRRGKGAQTKVVPGAQQSPHGPRKRSGHDSCVEHKAVFTGMATGAAVRSTKLYPWADSKHEI
jgi:hypothetical protein